MKSINLEQNVKVNLETSAYLANLELINNSAPSVANIIIKELEDQRSNIKLIASENFCSIPVQVAMGNLLTDKYAEGYSQHRFYAGCSNIDSIEDLASFELKKLFNCEHAYIQPHSGADANLIAFWAILRTMVQIPEIEAKGYENIFDIPKASWDELRAKLGNQKLLALDLYAGGHLTHGYRFNVSSQMFDVYTYGVNNETGVIDYDLLEKLILDVKPLIFLVGYSAYSRALDFERLRKIADSVNAVLMVDMAHFAGLVAGKVFQNEFNPVPYADIVTSTTHKTLRGPRGGLIMCKEKFAESVNKGCPLVIGGPIPNIMAAKVVSFIEANSPAFRLYAHQIVENARAVANCLMEKGAKVISNGTDNHIVLVDVRPFGLTGRQAESALRDCNITLNRNTVPGDTNGPWYTSGIRIGTPAITTIGMKEKESTILGNLIHQVLLNTTPGITKSGKKSKAQYTTPDNIKEEVKETVAKLLDEFKVYPEIDLSFIKQKLNILQD